MPYIAAIIFVIGAGLGFSGSTWLYSSRIESLSTALSVSNEKAELELEAAKQRVEKATVEAQQLNNQLSNAHEQTIKTVNYLRDRLSSTRLPTCSEDNRNPMPTSASAAGVSTQTGYDELPTDFIELVKSEAYRADTVATYAETCWKFVTNNCGVN